MIDVFVRIAPATPLRAALAAAVIARLAEEPALGSLTLLVRDGSGEHWPRWPHGIAGDRFKEHWLLADDFHRASKAKAAELAQSEWLIIVDDDQLPLYRGWIQRAEQLAANCPSFAAIAGWSVTAEVPRPTYEVDLCGSIGCPMIVRREALLAATREPIDEPHRADTILTQRLQRSGCTGIARDWRYNHLGMGYSQVIPQHWMPEVPA